MTADATAGWTGNPFVDSGLAVAAAMKKLPGGSAVTNDVLREIVGDGTAIARDHQKLKSVQLGFR